MPQFDYYNCKARKNYLLSRNFTPLTFFILSFFNLILVILGIALQFNHLHELSGWGQIFIAVAMSFQTYYIARKYTIFSLENSQNSADRLNFELFHFLELVIFEAQKEDVKEITPEYIFDKSFLSNEGTIFLIRMGLPLNIISQGKKRNFMPQFSQELIDCIFQIKEKEITYEDLMVVIIHQSEGIKNFLLEVNIEQKDTDKLLYWQKSLFVKEKKSWQDETMVAGIGQDWSSGYTPILSRYSVDISRYFNDPNLRLNIFSHQEKIEEISTILAKPGKNNVLLVGEPGVGKKTVVNALALQIGQGRCMPALKYQKIKQLDVGRLLAGAAQGELEARLQGALTDAVNAGNIILYIDNFQSLLGGYEHDREEVGGIDASGYLIPFLQSSGLHVIASVTPDEYFNRVRSNGSISGAFEKVNIEPASTDDTLSIMLESLLYIEQRYQVFFLVQTLKKIIQLSDRYVRDVPFPEKALRLMEEAATNFATEKLSIIEPEQIESLVSKRTNVPVGEVQAKEKEKLLNLEQFMHKKIIGQVEAVSAVCNAMRRARSGLASEKRPVGVFLFLGPTGVGKTETAKALAEIYFGSVKEMTRLDMSEYQQPNSINQLIGTMDNPNGILTTAIIEKPFSLILLDELEKADKNILNVFLQVFEDGRLTNPHGQVLDFTNAIIIATSNAGSELIREKVELNQAQNLKELLIEKLQQDGSFTPEFLNRFDSVVVFKPLTADELLQIAQLMIDQLNRQLKEKNIKIEVDTVVLQKLAQLGYDPQFGARPMRRVIQEKVENLLAKKMLSGEVGEKQVVQIGINDIT